MTQLSNSQVDNACLEMLAIAAKRFPYYVPHFYFMHHFGVRVGEVFNNHIALATNGTHFEIYPQKQNNARTYEIINSEIADNLENLILTQENSYLNKRNLQRIVKEINPYRTLKRGNKNIGAHLFRHNYIKKLIADGKQFSTINNMLGYTNQTVANTYATSEIYY